MRLIEKELLTFDDLLPAPAACTLTPSQATAAEALRNALSCTTVLLLKASAGLGKTTILRHLQVTCGGALIETEQVIEELLVRNPAALEEAFFEAVREGMELHNLIFVDDLHLVDSVVNSYSYARRGLFAAFLNTLQSRAERNGQTLVFAYDRERPPYAVAQRAHSVTLEEFTHQDYRAIARAILGDAAEMLDFARIHRFAPSLNGHQLKTACRLHAGAMGVGTDRFTDYLTSQNLVGSKVARA